VKSIQVQNGDITVTQGSMQFVTGSNKLAQQLALWIKEPMYGNPPIGIGYTTPGFGSVLSGFIGQADTSLVQSQIKSEVLRVLGNYQQTQYFGIQAAQTTASLANWNKSEIIQQIINVDVTVDQFTVSIVATVQTLANTTVPISIAVGQNGITVS
jgi:hypothetical protein